MYKRKFFDPRIIISLFDSKCAETGKEIKKGSECIYYPSSREVFCMDSKQAETFFDWRCDVENLNQNY